MKSRQIVMNQFSTIHTSFVVDFKFTNNITILTGDSGTGKTTDIEEILTSKKVEMWEEILVFLIKLNYKTMIYHTSNL